MILYDNYSVHKCELRHSVDLISKQIGFSWRSQLLAMTFIIQMIVIFVLSYIIYRFISKTKNFKNCLPNKVVLITGASSGIGEALAHVFYIAGCRLILTARRKDELERVRKDLLQKYSTKVTHPPVVMTLDIADLKALKEKAQQALNIHGHIDILVNNSGITYNGEIKDTKHEDDMKIMMTNYFGTIEFTKTILPSMIQRKNGKLVFISSVLGKFTTPYVSPYVASKYALEGFCETLRSEVHDDNIKVTVISPGYVNTNIMMNSTTSSGKVFENDVKGMTTMEFAYDALKAILNDEKDVIIAQWYIKAFYWIKILCPAIYYRILVHRYRTGEDKP